MKKTLIVTLLLSIALLLLGITQCTSKSDDTNPERNRLIVLTDYYKDPDDIQSMIRLLLYANEFDIRGIIATSLAYGTGEVHPEWIKETIDYYGKVRPNLILHDTGYPSADSLKAVVKPGAKVIRKYAGPGKGFKTPFGLDLRTCNPATDYIGEGKDTEGSEHIIKVIDESSSPTWIIVWGGSIDLAQALWKVKNTRDPQSVAEFISKIHYYQINWQDTGATWLWEEFPQLFRIQGLDLFKGIYKEGDTTYKNQSWVDANIRNDHGVLGAQYPDIKKIDGIKEGDSPSLLYLIPNGLSNPEKPEYGSWGGRFKPYKNSTTIFVDAMDKHPNSSDELRSTYWTVARWNKAANLDFAARMDWCVKSYQEANHQPVVKLNHRKDLTAKSGSTVNLSAKGTYDPDDDRLTFRWWNYNEAGDYEGDVEIKNADAVDAALITPTDIHGETYLHIICEVKDNGTPQLTRYQRVIIKIMP